MTASHRVTVRVYYEDTDFSGVVYHANYLRFLERARTEWLRSLGVDQAALFAGTAGQPPAFFAVRRMRLDFRAAARMDDLVTVESRAVAVGGASITLDQRLVRDRDLLVEAEVRVALVRAGRPARLPAGLAARLSGAVNLGFTSRGA